MRKMEMEISFFEKFGSNSQIANLLDVLGSIRNGDFKVLIEELRGEKIDERKYGELKKRLPHFTPSGTFEPNRRAENLRTYNGVMVIDIDRVGEKAKPIKDLSTESDFTLSAFLSPGGNGVKILVRTDSVSAAHEQSFDAVATYYENLLGVPIDRSGKDISRACFVSYDPELYINKKSSVFSSTTSTQTAKFSTESSTSEPEMTFQSVLNFTQRIDTYAPGGRNNFIFKLANNLNRAGISQQDAKYLITSNFTDSDITREIPAAIKSAYTHTGEHGIFGPDYFISASSASSATAARRKIEQNTPTISEEVYFRLPRFLQECTSVFDGKRERDIFFTGMLTILSGCFNNVEGRYHGRTYSPNLYSFTIAGPGSCKGVMIFSRQLGTEIHNRLKVDSETSIFPNITCENKAKWFYIPADSSSAAIKRMLIANSEQGTICETEADTLSATLSQDWGGFDDLLRKAFQHEPITTSRVDKEADSVVLREISHPKLSVCLTGTPSQVPTLLKSTENGLFSRFMFYTFRNEEIPEFKDVFANDDNDGYDEYFAEKAVEVYNMYHKVNELGKCRFSFNINQKMTFMQEFNLYLKRLHEQHGEETHAIVFRLGLITFRIAMVLTIIRKLEENVFSGSIECSDDDFQTSLDLSAIYLEHSLAVFHTLPGSKQINQNAITLLNFLPTEFTNSKAEKIGEVYCGISKRSTQNYLNELVHQKLLLQPKRHGVYYRQEVQ